MKIFRILMPLVLTYGMSHRYAIGRPLPVTLDELVNYADIVAEVEAMGDSPPLGSSSHKPVVSLRVLDVLQGDTTVSKGDSLPLRPTASGTADEAPVSSGHRYIVFLVDCGTGYHIIFGYGGRVPINGGTVQTGDIVGAAPRQPLSRFIDSMGAVKNLPTLSAIPRDWLCGI